MDQALELRGVILKHRPVGDYDWIVTLLTMEKGKLNAFARAARRPNTRLAGNVEPLSFGTFSLYPGKNSYTMTDARIDRYFESFRADLEKAAYGSFFLELADYYTRENMEADALLRLLYVSLSALESENEMLPKRLVRCVFEIRALVTEGIFPGAANIKTKQPGTARALHHIESAPLAKLYSFTLREEALEELCETVRALRGRFLDRKLKSLDMIQLYEGEHGND